MILFVCWIFTCGMPILTLACCGMFTLKYFTDKYVFLRMSSRPNKIDASINTWLIHKLSVALILHIIFSLLMLTVRDIFNPSNANSNEGME